MKKAAIVFAAAVAPPLFGYLLGSFYFVSFDIRQWSPDGRGFAILMACVCWAGGAIGKWGPDT